MKIDMVITENPSFLAYLIEAGIVENTIPWYEWVAPADVIGKHVLGENLPYCLTCLTGSYTEVPVILPHPLVGHTLIMADYEKYAGEPVTYSVRCETKTRVHRNPLESKGSPNIYWITTKEIPDEIWKEGI